MKNNYEAQSNYSLSRLSVTSDKLSMMLTRKSVQSLNKSVRLSTSTLKGNLDVDNSSGLAKYDSQYFNTPLINQLNNQVNKQFDKAA